MKKSATAGELLRESIGHGAVDAPVELDAQFMAEMAHQLRTPLNVIAGFSELLKEGISGPLNAEQSQAVQEILDSSQCLLRLINQVSEFSQLGAGKLPGKAELIDIGELLESLEKTLAPVLRKRRQALELDISPASRFFADRRLLREVLLQLLDNASKFTPDGGEIRVSVRCFEGQCEFSVRDDGTGLSERDLARLFQPFIKLDNSLYRGMPGNGFGLTLVKEILSRFGGSIRVKSELAKGSEFRFSLPLGGPARLGGDLGRQNLDR